MPVIRNANPAARSIVPIIVSPDVNRRETIPLRIINTPIMIRQRFLVFIVITFYVIYF